VKDFLIADHGSIYLLLPQTPAAVTWIQDNLPADRPQWAGATGIEHRYVADILTGIGESGLSWEDA
jgi:hypothetical protein